MRLAIAGILGALLCIFAGCFQWTEDPQGKLQSVGLPGVPIWQSKESAGPMKPTDLGFTPEEAAKLGGPVLVMPSANSRVLRYRYYRSGENHCQDDLKKMLADRAQQGATDPAPYCTDNPTAPVPTGNAFVF